jgi:hypothetical protein
MGMSNIEGMTHLYLPANSVDSRSCPILRTESEVTEWRTASV